MRLALIVAGVAGIAAGTLWWMQPAALQRLTGATTDAGTQPATNLAASDMNVAAGPAIVEVAEARRARRSRDIKAIGSLQSDESVQLAPEIAGRISAIVFVEGSPVKQGDVLVKLDDALVAAEVAQARARLTLASANNDRARALSRTGNVTERSRDEATSSFETAQAELELAQTRLSKHLLRAPFDGIAGVRGVSVGAFVSAGTPIVNIEKIDSLKVDFKVPEIYLRDIKTGQAIEVRVDAFPQRTFAGEVYAINPHVDVNGRALQVRSRLANEDGALRPGLFARIALKEQSEHEVVLIPESAVLPRGGETFVFRVEDGKAMEQRVVLGPRANGEVEVVEGIAGDATIVTAGQQNLRSGSPVEVVAASRPQAPVPGVLPTASSKGSG